MVSVLQATIDTLQGQLEVKDRQLEQQVQAITRLTDALAAAQADSGSGPGLFTQVTLQQQFLTGVVEESQKNQEQGKNMVG